MDYTAWLGDADLTPEQTDAFTTAADAYYHLPLHAHRDPEDASAHVEDDDAALAAILQSILGEDTAQAAGERSRRARTELVGWVRAEAARGTSETAIAEQAGVTRPTVRAWIGK